MRTCPSLHLSAVGRITWSLPSKHMLMIAYKADTIASSMWHSFRWNLTNDKVVANQCIYKQKTTKRIVREFRKARLRIKKLIITIDATLDLYSKDSTAVDVQSLRQTSLQPNNI